MSQPQQPSQTAPPTAPGPIDQNDVQWWLDQFNNAVSDFNGTINSRSPAGASEWSHAFFSCLTPVDTCLLTCFCPCVTFGRTHHRFRKNAELQGWQPINTTCLVQGGTWWTGIPTWCFPIAAQRAAIRAKYNLEGSCLTDLLCGWCCSCCSIVQMDKEVEARERLVKGDSRGYERQTEMAYPGK